MRYTSVNNLSATTEKTHLVVLDLVGSQDYTVFPKTVVLARLKESVPEQLDFSCLREYMNLCHYKHNIARITRVKCGKLYVSR